MPKLLGVQNVIDQPIYDTVRLAAAANPTGTFFSVPVNGLLAAGVTKTYTHTNLVQAGRLEEGVSLVVRAFSMTVRQILAGATTQVTKADYQLILNHSNVNIQFGGTSFYRLPSLLIGPGPGEMNYFSNIAAAATEFQNNHGVVAQGNRFILANPIEIAPLETIQVDLAVEGTVGAVTDVQFVMWGDLTRPVR